MRSTSFRKPSTSVSRPTILSVTMSANIDALPNELLLFIFKHLNIQDLVHCRSVCKRFLFLCHEVKISELQISNTIKNVKYYSFHRYKQFNHKDAIDVSRLTTYRTMFRLGEFLKRLHFKGNISDFYQLNLNDLTQLVDLRICLKIAYNADLAEIHLSLPNLKVLEIDIDFDDDSICVFHLTTPKLQILKCDDFDVMHIADPSTIECLEMYYESENFLLMENVQILTIQMADFDSTHSNVNFLSLFPKLKMLFCQHILRYNIHNLFGLKLKKPELKIYVESVELIDSGKVDEYIAEQSNLAFQINNYNLLCDKISDSDPLHYNELMRLTAGTLPNDFYNKYANVTDITVSGKVENQNHLQGFLKRFDYLRTLSFKDTVLDQSFFDCLEVGQITQLNVKNCPIVNYDFLLKFQLLKLFQTFNDADLFDLSFQLFRRLKYFKYIWFGFNEESVRMGRERDDRMDRTEYMFSHDQDIRTPQQMNFDDFDQLVHAVTTYKIQMSTNGLN